MSKRLPATKETLDVGTYIRLLEIRKADTLFDSRSLLEDQIYMVGGKTDKYAQSNLIKNNKTEYKKEKNYYSGPITNIRTGEETFIASALVEEIKIRETPKDLEVIPEGTKILLMAVPTQTHRLGGKIVTVGAGGLHKNFPADPDTYGGIFYEDGNSQAQKAFGIRLKLVEVEKHSKSNCDIPGCQEQKWKDLSYCQVHTATHVQQLHHDCNEHNCTLPINMKEKNCEHHGGKAFELQKFKINSLSYVYSTIGSLDGMPWPSDEIRKATSTEAWGTWRPQIGAVGYLVWKGQYRVGNKEVYILNINNKLVAVDEKGLTLVEEVKETHAEAQKRSQEEEIALINAEREEIIKGIQELFDEIVEEVKINESIFEKRTPTQEEVAKSEPNFTPNGNQTANTASKSDGSSLSTANAASIIKSDTPIVTNSSSKKEEVTIETSAQKGQKVQEQKMATESFKDRFVKTAKKDFDVVSVRLAAKKLNKTIATPLAAYLNANLGDNSEASRARIARFLTTELGQAFVSLVVSGAMSALPKQFSNDFLERLKDEMRWEGELGVSSVATDIVLDPLLAVMSMYITPDLSQQTASPFEQPAIEELKEEEIVEEVVEAPVPLSASR